MSTVCLQVGIGKLLTNKLNQKPDRDQDQVDSQGEEADPRNESFSSKTRERSSLKFYVFSLRTCI